MNRRGLALALVHLGLVGSLALKLQYDRAMLPHGWAKVAPADPNLPVRGRYVSLALELPWRGESTANREDVSLRVEGREVIAEPRYHGIPAFVANGRARLTQPVGFFIPEHVADPSRRPPGEELWAEVTLVPDGLPRPLRLAVKRGDRLEILAVE